MDLERHPDLIDRLAGEYVLGVLRGGARRRLEQLAGREPALRAAIDAWHARLAALPELARAVEPPASLWPSIERRLGLAPLDTRAQSSARSPAPANQPRWFDSLTFWRGWSIAATGAAAFAAMLALVVSLQLQPFTSGSARLASTSADEQHSADTDTGAPVIERVAYVAALADVKTDKTMVFVMWDNRSAMMSVHRMSGGDAAPPGKSEELWGIPEHGRPVSLGRLPPGRIVHMKVPGMNAFARLAVSVEPMSGAPGASGPSGPVVCAGKLMATA